MSNFEEHRGLLGKLFGMPNMYAFDSFSDFLDNKDTIKPTIPRKYFGKVKNQYEGCAIVQMNTPLTFNFDRPPFYEEYLQKLAGWGATISDARQEVDLNLGFVRLSFEVPCKRVEIPDVKKRTPENIQSIGDAVRTYLSEFGNTGGRLSSLSRGYPVALQGKYFTCTHCLPSLKEGVLLSETSSIYRPSDGALWLIHAHAGKPKKKKKEEFSLSSLLSPKPAHGF